MGSCISKSEGLRLKIHALFPHLQITCLLHHLVKTWKPKSPCALCMLSKMFKAAVCVDCEDVWNQMWMQRQPIPSFFDMGTEKQWRQMKWRTTRIGETDLWRHRCSRSRATCELPKALWMGSSPLQRSYIHTLVVVQDCQAQRNSFRVKVAWADHVHCSRATWLLLDIVFNVFIYKMFILFYLFAIIYFLRAYINSFETGYFILKSIDHILNF